MKLINHPKRGGRTSCEACPLSLEGELLHGRRLKVKRDFPSLDVEGF